MNSVPAALAVLAATVICLGYLLPGASRRRQADAEIRTEDRFSERARVVESPAKKAAAARSSAPLLPRTRVQRTVTMQRPATSRPIKPARPVAPRAIAASPDADAVRAEAVPPSQRAARPTHAVPLADAARLRASILIALALLTTCAVVLSIAAGLTWWAAVACAALAGGVLVWGRRAAVAQQSAGRRASTDAERTTGTRAARLAAARAGASGTAVAQQSAGRRTSTDVGQASEWAAQRPAAQADTSSGAASKGASARSRARGEARAAKAAPARAGAQRRDRATAGPLESPRGRADGSAGEARGAISPSQQDGKVKHGGVGMNRGTAAGAAAAARSSGDELSARPLSARPGPERAQGTRRAGGGGTAPGEGEAQPGVRRSTRPAAGIPRGERAFRLPEPLEIKAVEAEEVRRAARRFTTPKPKTVAEPAAVEAAQEEQPTPRPEETGGLWAPRGIPAPSYTTMPNAPRWEPKPLTSADYAQARRAATEATRRAAEQARAEGVETAATGQLKVPARVIFSDDALDLDRAIAARRRAAGAE